MSTHLVFVYGTLKRGQPNHEKITNPENGQATFIGEARTVEKWPLVVATKFNIPFLLDKPGLGHHVQGEVYKIDEAMLEVLDKMERHPRVHTRSKIEVEYNSASKSQTTSCTPGEIPAEDASREIPSEGTGGGIQTCWCYAYGKYTDDMVDMPYVDAYDAVGNPDHEYTWDTVYIKQGMTREEGMAHLLSKTFKE